MCHALYFYLITGFGNPLALLNGTWSLFSSIATNVVIAFIVQCFFTKQIFLLCSPQKRWWVTGIIAITVLAHFVFGLETVIFFAIKKEFMRLKEVTLMAVVPFGTATVLSDIIIAIALCVLLGSNRSSFKDSDTNNIINKIIVFVISRGILLSAVAVAETIVFSVQPNSLYSLAIDFVIGKVYANSLLVALNSRAGSNSQDVSDSAGFRVARHLDNITFLGPVQTRESTTMV